LNPTGGVIWLAARIGRIEALIRTHLAAHPARAALRHPHLFGRTVERLSEKPNPARSS